MSLKSIVKPLSTALAVFTTVVALLTSCNGSKRVSTLFIISTNDIHANIDRMPLLATMIGEYRTQDTAAVVVLDAGDRWTGNPYVDQVEEKGSPMMQLFKLLHYDAVTYGNHEFDYGLDVLDKRIKEGELDAVLANIATATSPLSQPQPFTVITAGGRRVAVVGVVTNADNGHPEGDNDKYVGVTFFDPIETATHYQYLKAKSDILVALTHIGSNYDTLLAKAAPDFDLIVGGHTHTVIDTLAVVDGVVITQTGSKLRYAGLTTVTFKGRKIESIDNRLIDLDSYAPDPQIAAMVSRFKTDPYMNECVGLLTRSATKEGIAAFITDVARERARSDIALYHRGGVRSDVWAVGDVNRALVFQTEPFGTQIVTVDLTEEQIKKLIVDKFNDRKILKESHRVDLYPSGMNYTIVTDPSGDAVDVELDIANEPHDGVWKVALSDYVFRQYDFDHPDSCTVVGRVTDLMLDRLAEGEVVPDNEPRAKIK